MPPAPIDPDDLVRRAGRRYVPERAMLTGVPGAPELSGVTTISDLSSYGIGLLQTFPMEMGQRFMLLKGTEQRAEQVYEVVYCREQSGVFRIGARRVAGATSASSSTSTVSSSAN